MDYPIFVCEGTTDSEIKSADKKKEEFIETLKYADRLLKEFDNDLNKVAQQLNKEGKRTYLGHSWLVDNLRVSLKRLYDGKYGPYYK